MNRVSFLLFASLSGLVATAQKSNPDVHLDLPKTGATGFVGSTLFWIIVIIVILALLSGGGYYSRRRRYYGGRRRVIRETVVDDDDDLDVI
jgi:hypothetical protein